jgi:hypothetical protein
VIFWADACSRSLRFAPCASDPDWGRAVLDPWARSSLVDACRRLPPGLVWVVDRSVVCLYKFGLGLESEPLVAFFVLASQLAAWSSAVSQAIAQAGDGPGPPARLLRGSGAGA